MKNKILEVQNYFVNKITACDFRLENIEFQSDGWAKLDVFVDEFYFRFSVKIDDSIFCLHESEVKINIPNDRLENLLKLIKEREKSFKTERINALKQELEALEK